MAITVYLGTVAKRNNSTLVPPSETLQPFTGELNQDFLLTAPQIFFELPVNKAPEYNYAYIPSFNRYFFVTAWNFAAGLWLANMTVDVLATYKKEIGNSRLYVLRSSSQRNQYLIDNKYPAESNRHPVSYRRDNIFTPYLSGGCYVVGIVNKSTGTGESRMGAVQYYVMSPTRMEEFISIMFADVDYFDVDKKEISKELQAMLINPFQYVVSAMWFPFRIGTWTTVVNIPVGWWPLTGTGGGLFSNPYSNFSMTIDVPKHPQTNERGWWVNESPYTTYSLEFWPFGVIPLDSSKLLDVSTLIINVSVDHISGVGTLRITDESGTLVASSTAQIGVPLQLAQLSVDYGRLQGASGAAMTAAGAAALTEANKPAVEKEVKIGTLWESVKAGASAAWSGIKAIATGNGKDVIQNVVSTASDVGNALNSILADVQVSGGNGGRAAYSLDININMHYSTLVPDDNDHDGRPLCDIRKLDTLRGFVLCKSGDIALEKATQGEKDLVRAFLEGGFFYE